LARKNFAIKYVEYVSAEEGVKFVAIMKEMTEQLEALGPEKIKAENEKLRPVLDRMLSRKKKELCGFFRKKLVFNNTLLLDSKYERSGGSPWFVAQFSPVSPISELVSAIP
jgi:hypothetical protein